MKLNVTPTPAPSDRQSFHASVWKIEATEHKGDDLDQNWKYCRLLRKTKSSTVDARRSLYTVSENPRHYFNFLS